MKKRRWVVGTRGSKLALTQTGMVVKMLQSSYPDCQFFTKTIKTTGDTIWDKPLHLIGGKGLFVKEIEEDLLRHGIDIAVHSMKDVPTALEPGLTIAAVLRREDPRDVLISDTVASFNDIPDGGRIGTNSLRRKAQILYLRKDIEVVPLRGNVDTRIRKMSELKLDGIILAYAGVKRMGFEDHIREILSLQIMIPSSGQGAIAVETRDEPESLDLVRILNDPKSYDEVSIERKVQIAIGGSCQVPLGVHAVTRENSFTLYVTYGEENGNLSLRDTWTGGTNELNGVIEEVLGRLRNVIAH